MQDLFKIKCSDLAKLKKLPPRDQGHYLPFNTYPHGCPLGGFGAGTIGRSPYGDFNIWHIKVGAHIAEEIKACTFHVYQKTKEKTFSNTLTARPYTDSYLQNFAPVYAPQHVSYSAAYPKAKYVFNDPAQPAEITCEQYSPVLPNNYQETSFPVAIFEHTLRNKTDEPIEAALAMSWADMTGWGFADQRPGIQDNWFKFVKNPAPKIHTIHKAKNLNAVIMGNNPDISTPLPLRRQKSNVREEMDGQIGIAVIGGENIQTSAQPYFYINGTGENIQSFRKTGLLDDKNPPHMLEHQNYGAAVAGKVLLKPRESKKITFILTWDLPLIHFGAGINRYKYYTRFFNKSATNASALLKIAAQNYPQWSDTIDNWHQKIMDESVTAGQLKSDKARKNYFQMLINELYFLADGGSYWDAETGSYGLLECFDYPFYETLDVRFYGSFPLLKFWPEIELKVMRDFAKTIGQADNQMRRYHSYADKPALPLPKKSKTLKLYYDRKKIAGACPHDLGSPKHEPFKQIAAYTWQNTNYWKDLNAKFILLCYRDYKYTDDKKFLRAVWPAMQEAMQYLKKMDKNKDGIPENSGFPDQTYDNWVMTGVSAYCGSLWLAALSALNELATVLGETRNPYADWLGKAQKTFEKKLWNGKYYDFCEGNNDIMADQLIGQWYLDLLNSTPILDERKITSALKTIYKYCYRGTARGKWGIVSGKTRSNKFTAAEQGRDVWVGANFALCSLFLKHGMNKEAQKVLNTMSEIIYGKGFFFRTPEGWDTKGQFTATMYMRPNAVWALEF